MYFRSLLAVGGITAGPFLIRQMMQNGWVRVTPGSDLICHTTLGSFKLTTPLSHHPTIPPSPLELTISQKINPNTQTHKTHTMGQGQSGEAHKATEGLHPRSQISAVLLANHPNLQKNSPSSSPKSSSTPASAALRFIPSKTISAASPTATRTRTAASCTGTRAH